MVRLGEYPQLELGAEPFGEAAYGRWGVSLAHRPCRECVLAISTAEEFLTVLEKSRLLTPEQMGAARQQAAEAGGNPRPLVESLMQRRLLTRWQVNQLLSSHSTFYLGKYKLLDKIGEGGMGKVFKAEHTTMDRVVALKLLPVELTAKPDSVARFRREVHMAASLHHPNIVTAYDADQVSNRHFLVMEYVEGNSLFEWLKQHGRLPIDWACECVRQAALGLEYAHRKGVIHRDIKPNNLLVVAADTSGVPVLKILDMGLARSKSEQQISEEITQSDQVLGTPDYISPEQADDSRSADARSDIYSLGCTLFKMLTGQLPFGGRSAMEKIAARLKYDAPRATSLRPEIPPGLDAAIARMLARNPADRIQTCQEVAKVLEPYASGTAGASEESSSIMLCSEARGWSPSQAHTDSALNEFLSALSNTPDQNTPAMGHSRTLVEPREGLMAPRAGRPRRNGPDQKKLLLMGSSAVVGLLLALGLLWALWPRPAVLTVQWLPDDRRGATLTINGHEQALNASGPVTFELQPGTYEVFIARRGYEPISEEKNVARGDHWILIPKWRKVELALPTFENKPRPTVDPPRLKTAWVAAQTKRQQELAAALTERTDEFKALKTEIEQTALKATTEQAAALSAKVLDFRRRWLGADEAAQAAALLMKLPSPADKLNRAQIPEHELLGAGGGNARQAPSELAWVFGDSRLKHDGRAQTVAFSPTSSLAAVGTERGNIDFWDPQTGKLIRELTGGHATWVWGLAFSPDGRWLASSSDEGAVQLWETATGQQGLRLSGHTGRIRSLAFSRDGKLLASGCLDKKVRVWDARTGDLLHTLTGHTGEVLSVAFDTQQDLLASGSLDKTARLWDPVSGEKRHTLQHAGQVTGLAFTADGQRLAASGNDGLIKLWNTRTGSDDLTLNWDGGGISFLAISPQRDRLAMGNSSRVWVRSIALGDVRLKFEMPGITAAAFSSDGGTLGVCSYGGLRLFDAETGQQRLPSPGHASLPRGLVFAPDGASLYSTAADETVQAWDITEGRQSYEQKTPQGESLAISPDGQRLALASASDVTVRVLDAATGLERMILTGHSTGNYAAAFSPDGKQLASGGQDPVVRIWDLATKAEVAQLQGPLHHIRALTYGLDGRLYAGYNDGQIYVWDVAKKEPVLVLPGHAAGITRLALHSSGQFLASGGTDDSVKVWDLRKAEAVQTLAIPTANGHDVAFALDGQTLLATGTEGSIRFWDFRTGRQLRVWRMSDVQPFRMALSPDGRYLATGLRDGTIQLLRITER
jgi:WD40 repeat protein/serine/threonine protein kinase